MENNKQNMAKKVLVVVDVQNDFVKGGPLAYGYPTKSNTQDICTYVTKSLVVNKDYVVATRDTHHDNYLYTLEGSRLPIMHCIHQTKGWELVDGISCMAYTGNGIQIFDKSTFGTPLVAEHIRGLIDSGEDIDEIQICGYRLSICVLAIAVMLRARFPNKKITVLKDLCGDIDEESFNAAIIVLKNQQIEVV